MRKRSNIVSFDEARKSSQRRKAIRSQQRQEREDADSHKLSLIFELDFGNDDDSFSYSQSRAASYERRSGSRSSSSSGSRFNSNSNSNSNSNGLRDSYDYRDKALFDDGLYNDALFEEPREEVETTAPAKKGLFASLQEKKRKLTKGRAEKQFNKTYGSSNLPSGDINAGPRAALYKGEMGAKQRLATRMQDREQRTGVSFSFPILNRLPELPKLPKGAMKTVGIVLSVVLLVTMLYTPAQQYYHQLRERDRLSAEYAAVIERNNALQATVDSLQSEAGIEDKAHSEFGLVREGEEAGSVTGIDPLPPTSKFSANVAPGSVPAPETWYSPVLDILFLYAL